MPDHPTYRVRNQRTGRWIELPTSDGTIFCRVTRLVNGQRVTNWEHVTFEYAHECAKAYFAKWDNLPIEKRYEYAYGTPNKHDNHTPTKAEYVTSFATSLEDLGL